MITIIENPNSYRLEKTSNLNDLKVELQHRLLEGEDISKYSFLNKDFNEIPSKIEQMTSDCIRITLSDKHFILLEGSFK